MPLADVTTAEFPASATGGVFSVATLITAESEFATPVSSTTMSVTVFCPSGSVTRVRGWLETEASTSLTYHW